MPRETRYPNPIMVRLSDNQLQRLWEMAEKEEMPPAVLARLLVVEGLERREHRLSETDKGRSAH